MPFYGVFAQTSTLLGGSPCWVTEHSRAAGVAATWSCAAGVTAAKSIATETAVPIVVAAPSVTLGDVTNQPDKDGAATPIDSDDIASALPNELQRRRKRRQGCAPMRK